MLLVYCWLCSALRIETVSLLLTLGVMSDILPEFKKWIVVISVSWGATFIALICYKYIISILLAIMFQDSMDMNLSKLQEIVKDSEAWHAAVHGVAKSQTWLGDWTTTNESQILICLICYLRGGEEKPLPGIYYLEVLSWPKSSLRLFWKMLWKSLNKFLTNPIHHQRCLDHWKSMSPLL